MEFWLAIIAFALMSAMITVDRDAYGVLLFRVSVVLVPLGLYLLLAFWRANAVLEQQITASWQATAKEREQHHGAELQNLRDQLEHNGKALVHEKCRYTRVQEELVDERDRHHQLWQQQMHRPAHGRSLADQDALEMATTIKEQWESLVAVMAEGGVRATGLEGWTSALRELCQRKPQAPSVSSNNATVSADLETAREKHATEMASAQKKITSLEIKLDTEHNEVLRLTRDLKKTTEEKDREWRTSSHSGKQALEEAEAANTKAMQDMSKLRETISKRDQEISRMKRKAQEAETALSTEILTLQNATNHRVDQARSDIIAQATLHIRELEKTYDEELQTKTSQTYQANWAASEASLQADNLQKEIDELKAKATNVEQLKQELNNERVKTMFVEQTQQQLHVETNKRLEQSLELFNKDEQIKSLQTIYKSLDDDYQQLVLQHETLQYTQQLAYDASNTTFGFTGQNDHSVDLNPQANTDFVDLSPVEAWNAQFDQQFSGQSNEYVVPSSLINNEPAPDLNLDDMLDLDAYFGSLTLDQQFPGQSNEYVVPSSLINNEPAPDLNFDEFVNPDADVGSGTLGPEWLQLNHGSTSDAIFDTSANANYSLDVEAQNAAYDEAYTNEAPMNALTLDENGNFIFDDPSFKPVPLDVTNKRKREDD